MLMLILMLIILVSKIVIQNNIYLLEKLICLLTVQIIYKSSYNMAKINVEFDIHDICCPITKQIFFDPVLASDGFVYEKDAIIKWFNNSDISPMTGKKIDEKKHMDNTIMKNMVADILSKNLDLLNEQYKKEQPKKQIYTFNMVIDRIMDNTLDIDLIEEIVDYANTNINHINHIDKFWKHVHIRKLVKMINKSEFSVVHCESDGYELRLVNDCIFYGPSIDIIKYVIDNTPNIDLIFCGGTADERTILDRIIVNNNNPDIVEYVFQKSINFDIFSDAMDRCYVFEELCKMSKNNDRICCNFFEIISKYIDSCKKKQNNYISYIFQYGTVKMLEYMLDLLCIDNFDCELKIHGGVSFIELACVHKNTEIIDYLLGKNVNLLHKNDNGVTVLHLISGLAKNDHDLCEKIVLQYSEQLKNKNNCSE